MIDDLEPCAPRADFWHPPNYRDGTPTSCPHAGKSFRENSNEVEPFERKRVRRAKKRATRSRLRLRA